MLISCPKCNAVYQVPENQIPADGKKFKCAECGEIWFVRPQAKPKENVVSIAPAVSKTAEQPAKVQINPQIISTEAAQNDDLEKMFNRLSKDTKGLFSGKESADTRIERAKRKFFMFFSPFMINCSILLFIFVCTLYIGYANRFELVSAIPQLENFYNKLGVNSLYKGKNLVFQNVSARNIEHDGKAYVEISGNVFNDGDMTAIVLPIKVTLQHLDGSIEAEAVKNLTLDRLEPNFRALFRILLPDSSLDEKKVILSFDENAQPQSKEKAKKFSDKE